MQQGSKYLMYIWMYLAGYIMEFWNLYQTEVGEK